MERISFAVPIPDEKLTESQKRAVYHRDGPLLVLAGPGSGKTRVITSRIAALINSGVRPYNICAITFTNKAAEEMRNRVGRFTHSSGVHISTFHSLCVRLLRQYGAHCGVTANFTIYDDADQKRCVKEAIKRADYESSRFTPASMLAAISKCKNDLEDPDEVKSRGDTYYVKALGRIYSEYQRILLENNALDFDDLLVKTAHLLRDRPDIRSEISARFRYILVDEYQDTNHAQYQIAKGLALEHGNICVTGDPDQSIYRWRGADITNILAFEKDWPNAVVIKLEENFRSTPNILAMADKLIATNTNRKEKTLIPTRQDGQDAVIECYGDEKNESAAVAGQIKQLIARGTDPATIAVFYRVNSMSRPLEEAFIDQQLPYQVVRGVEFYARGEIKDMLSYLKLIVNPSDDVAFLRAVTTHSRGIGKKTIEKAAEHAHYNGAGIFENLENAHKIPGISAAARKKLGGFYVMIKKFSSEADGPVAALMEKVFTETGYLESLQSGGDKEQSAIENIDELINAASRYDQNTENPSLVDYLQSIALYSDSDAYDAESSRVSLMTLHAAKGLEFENVFIVGLEEGLLPHERSMDSPEEMEEERRLFFVGITRAKDSLFISHAKHRVVRGQFLRTVPSQFLYEIGYKPDSDETDFDTWDDKSSPQSSNELVYENVDTEPQQGRYRVNELVEHSKFGLGRVKEFLELGENSIVVVRFNSGKTKSLMLKYAKLTRAGT